MSAAQISSGSDTITIGVSNPIATTIGGPITTEVAQILELATGTIPTSAQLSGWGAYLNGGGSLDYVASAFVASTMFANLYNGGALVNPNSSPATAITQGIIDHALGSHTSTQVNAWVNAGVSVAKVFENFALGDQFTSATHVQNAALLSPIALINPQSPIEIVATGQQNFTVNFLTPSEAPNWSAPLE